MAELVKYHGQVTSASTASNLQPVASRTVLVTKRGATVDGNQTVAGGGNLTLHAGGLRFATDDIVQIAGDITKIDKVSSVTNDTTIVLVTGMTVVDGERLVNLGNDSSGGTGTPQYDGADDKVSIYAEPVSTGTAATDNKVTTDSDGEYSFWAASDVYDISIMDSSTQLGSGSQTLVDVRVGSISNYEYVTATSGTSQEDFINAAITSVSGAGGGVVELSPGTFTIDAAVVVKDNVWLRGSGMGSTIIQVKASTAINVMEQLGTSLVSFVRISDMTLDGNDANQSSGGGLGANFRNISTLLVENVEVKDTRGTGINYTANDVNTERFTVRNCYIHDVASDASTGYGVSVSTSATITHNDTFITNNYFEDIGDGNTNTTGTAVNVASSGTLNNTVVHDNIMRTMRGGGIRVAGTIGKTSMQDNYIVDAGQAATADGGNGIICLVNGATIISGNTIDGVADSSDNGIEVNGDGGDKIVISNNRITNILNAGKSCISVGSNDEVIVSGNVCVDNVGNGISIVGASATQRNATVVVGNISEGNAGTGGGIRIGGRTGLSATGNVVQGNGGAGITFDEGFTAGFAAGDTCVVSGNTIFNNTGSGISMDLDISGGTNGRTVNISGNTVYSNGDRGLRISECDGLVINGNVIEANSESGMILATVTDCTIVGNLIKNNGVGDVGTSDNDGILLDLVCDSILISGNSFIDNASAGAFAINDGGTTTNLVIGDNFMRGNTATASVSASYDVASATTVTLPTTGNYFNVTGTTAITSVTATYPGHEVTLTFAGVLTFTDGSNLKLAGNFSTSADDTIRLVCDGTNWHEVSRSVN